MMMHFAQHGAPPQDGKLSVCELRRSNANPSTYWANVSETARLFLFVRDNGRAELALLNKETGRFVSLCLMDSKGREWRGIFGWLFFQAKPSLVEGSSSYVLYYSSQW